MQKREFIEEINRTIKGINLTDDNLGYVSKNTSISSGPPLFPVTYKITITYNGKTKTYQAGNGTTFPDEFVVDYNGRFYS